MRGGLRRTVEFWQDPAGKMLAELNAPLVERIDIPDDTLHEYLVLIEGDQRAKRAWVKLVEQ